MNLPIAPTGCRNCAPGTGPANSRNRLLGLALVFFLSGVLGGEPVRTGADRIFDAPYFDWIKGKRVGLITNPTGVNANLEATKDLLAHHPAVDLVALFAPEHGIDGREQAGDRVGTYGNVYSLYGEERSPSAEHLKKMDVLLYDLQDVGARFYTYISSLFLSMRAAAAQGIPFIVLDRPVPIGGSRVEGPMLRSGFESFVGIYNMPIRYGMTPGELAAMFNQEAGLKCDLRVVPLQGWKRGQWYDETGLQWISPSPNMATLTTAALYPGLCLIEGTNVSEGRGTTHPFELVGAPWLDNRGLVTNLNLLKLPGVRFRPQDFTPAFSKHEGSLCRGIQVHVTDRKSFQPVVVALHLLQMLLRLHPDNFAFREQHFDRLAGNAWIRESLTRGQQVEEIVRRWQPDLRKFSKQRQRYLRYR